MAWKKATREWGLPLGSLLVGILAILATYLAVTTWPGLILGALDSNFAKTSGAERLSALADIRSALLSGLAGVGAFIVALSALWQADDNRRARAARQSLEWSDSYARAVEGLSQHQAPRHHAAILTLSELSRSANSRGREAISASLASFIRVRSNPPRDRTTTQLAVNALYDCVATGEALDLSRSDLNGVDFGSYVLQETSFTESSMRGCKVRIQDRSHVETQESVDTGGIIWS